MPDYLPDILSTQYSYGRRFDKVGSRFHLSRQTAGVKTGLPAVAVSECHDAVLYCTVLYWLCPSVTML